MAGLRTDPWPHLVVDGFLPDDVLDRARTEVESEIYEFEIESRGTGRIEYSLLRSETLWRAVYTKRTIALLAAAFGAQVSLNRENYLQLRRMNGETPEFPRHSDYAAGQDTIASFLYLSDGWTADRGGRLNLYVSEASVAPRVAVEPLANRFVAFATKQAHWHSVERVAGWERLSVLALWDVGDALDAPTPGSA
jgi:hypothetical protein